MIRDKVAIALNIIKWPLALVSISFLPAIIVVLFVDVASFILTGSQNFIPILVGIAGYFVIWFYLIRKTQISFFSTLEHELTHCIFAYLCFNKVTGIKASLSNGGHMTFEGKTNWLIQTAPYFFPTVTVFLLIIIRFTNPVHYDFAYMILGASVVYHTTSTWTETHHLQVDLREAGFIFSFLFLPAANLICYAMIFSYLQFGLSGLVDVLEAIEQSPLAPTNFL